MRRGLIAGAIAALGWLSLIGPSTDATAAARQSAERLAVDRVLVGFRAATAASDRTRAQAATAPEMTSRAASLAARSGVRLRAAREITPRLATIALDMPVDEQSLGELLAALRRDPDVEFAEPDRRRFAHATSNDPGFTNQWYLRGNEIAAADFDTAWDTTKGENSVVIAVLDTGIRYDHPDLKALANAGRLLPGYDFVSADSNNGFQTANDGNGRDNDASDPGDWISSADLSGYFSDCSTGLSDSSWHGTRVAGMIGAITDNAEGIAGGTWFGRILPVRVLGKCGGYDSDIIAGMRWAAGLSVSGIPNNPNPARILNLSLGATESCPSQYRSVMTELTNAGVMVIASAGNETGPVDAPANCPGVLAVGGVRHVGTKVGYSSFGPEVGISAAAGNCVNTPPGACLFSLDTTTDSGAQAPASPAYTDQFNSNVGTSFSAPIVAAIAGLVEALHPAMPLAAKIRRIKSGAAPFPAVDNSIPICPSVANGANNAGQCNCTTTTCGAGIANAAGAVAEAARPYAAFADPGNVAGGAIVNLNGAGSTAARNRTIASYSWSIVNGGAMPPVITNAMNVAASLTMPASGPVQVRLTVTDSNGLQDSVDRTLGSPPSSGGGGGTVDWLTLVVLLGISAWRRRWQPRIPSGTR